MLFTYLNSPCSQPSKEISIFITILICMIKLRSKEVKSIAQGHTGPEFELGNTVSKDHLLPLRGTAYQRKKGPADGNLSISSHFLSCLLICDPLVLALG